MLPCSSVFGLEQFGHLRIAASENRDHLVSEERDGNFLLIILIRVYHKRILYRLYHNCHGWLSLTLIASGKPWSVIVWFSWKSWLFIVNVAQHGNHQGLVVQYLRLVS